MPKQKYTISKKHEYLINKYYDIPDVDEIIKNKWDKDLLLNGSHTDYRYNTEDALLMILKNLTKGTQKEDIAKEIVEKARAVFDYYSDREI